MTRELPLNQRGKQDSHRPGYHFLPPANWMNDPNGFVQWDGQYHLFYQYNPHGAFHDNIHWGHAVSDDLVRWQHLPIALAPTPQGHDKIGCWSGCLVDDRGTPTIVYTGAFPEVQCIAAGSEDLVTWEKSRANPVIAGPPSGLRVFGFRDPCVWKEDDVWFMVIGAGIVGVGGAILFYKSPNLIEWEYVGPLLQDDRELCGGALCECPAFFPLGDRYILVVSVAPRDRVDYFVGEFDGTKFYPESRRRVDYGRYFYAPQTLLDTAGRRVMIGWLPEGRSVAQDRAAGWSGVQSIPRALTLRPDGHLGMAPIEEYQSLRRRHSSFESLSLPADSPQKTGIHGSQLEVMITWQPDPTTALEVVLAEFPNGEEQTRIVFEPEMGELFVDRRHSNIRGDVDLDTQYARLDLGQGEALELRIFFDHSVIEVFANELVCLTSRIYPTLNGDLEVSFLSRHKDTEVQAVDVWELDSIW